jgi:hypothetical protein
MSESEFSKKRVEQYWYLGEQIPNKYITRIKEEFAKRTGQDPNQNALVTIIKIDAHKLWKGESLDSIFAWIARYQANSII